MIRFDVLILGGGPAGCAMAVELAGSGLSVGVLERTRYDDTRLGDTLPPEARVWLERLGVWEACQGVPHVTSPGIVSLWDTPAPAETDFLFNPYGPGWHLDRGRFDATLADLAQARGAAVFTGSAPRDCRVAVDGGWEVLFEIDGGCERALCRWLIDATGRKAWFLRRQGMRPRAQDRLVGVVAHFRDCAAPDQRLHVEAAPDGWWYSAPLPGRRAIAAFLTDSDLLPRGDAPLRSFWEERRAETRLVSAVFANGVLEAPLRIVSAGTAWVDRVAGEGWLAVGDAALAHDPLSGQGLRQSLASGWRAARALREAAEGSVRAGDEYQAWADEGRKAYERERASFYGRVTRWPDAPFWSRRREQAAVPGSPGPLAPPASSRTEGFVRRGESGARRA